MASKGIQQTKVSRLIRKGESLSREESKRIPKIIHQTWKYDIIPKKFQKWQNTWKTKHPDWGYRFWTDRDIRKFIENDFPFFLDKFNGYRHNIMRVDAFRPFLMFKIGGIYVDLDFECLKPIDPLVEEHQCVMGKEPYTHATYLYNEDWVPCNAFFASIPGHPFWLHYIQHLIDADPEETDPVYATGPLMLKQVVKSYTLDDITILEPELLYPIEDYANERLPEKVRREIRTEFFDAYAVHRWAHSWHGPFWVKYLTNRKKTSFVVALLIMLALIISWFFSL